MMKKFVITLISIILVAMIAFSMSSFVCAAGNFDVAAHEGGTENAFSKAGVTITGIILNAMRFAGAGIALIALVIIAMKYLYSKKKKKADYKKNLMVYTIGGLGMFSVGTILKIIKDVSGQIEGGTAATPES